MKALFVAQWGIGKDLSFLVPQWGEKMKAGKVLRVCALVNQCL